MSNEELEGEIKDEQNVGNSFSPVAISSPHSRSFEDSVGEDDHTLSDNYPQSSFDVFDTSLSLNFTKQPFSDIESTFDDLLENKDYSNSLMRIQPLHHQTMSDVRIVIENDYSNHHQLVDKTFHSKVVSEVNSSDDTGYQSSTNDTLINISHSKVKDKKIFHDHIFTRESFQGFHCNQFCCMTYIDKLFIDIAEKDIENSRDTSDHDNNITKVQIKRLKKSPSSTSFSNKLVLQNKKVSGYHHKKNQQTKESSRFSATQNGYRTQTPHMRGYIALRQQCRLNEDLSPLTKYKTLIPKLNSSIETGGIRKSKLKRKKAFKVHNKTDDIEKARDGVYKKYKSDSMLSTSSSFESLAN